MAILQIGAGSGVGFVAHKAAQNNELLRISYNRFSHTAKCENHRIYQGKNNL